MPDRSFAAIALDDEVVLLDPEHGRLVLLDAWARRIWQACGTDGGSDRLRTLGPRRRVSETLDALREAGAIRRCGSGWSCAPVRWL